VTLSLTLDRVPVILVRICGRRLPTHQIRWKSEKLFVDVHGRTDGRTDTRQFQSTRSSVDDDLKIKKYDVKVRRTLTDVTLWRRDVGKS